MRIETLKQKLKHHTLIKDRWLNNRKKWCHQYTIDSYNVTDLQYEAIKHMICVVESNHFRTTYRLSVKFRD